MQTAKPISTISYNTEPFLVQTLNALVKAKRIDFWAYIHHFPEDDEVKLKHHFHVYLEPSKRTQTATLKEEFLELDPNNEKPLGVLTFTRPGLPIGIFTLFTMKPTLQASIRPVSTTMKVTRLKLWISTSFTLGCMISTYRISPH